VKAVAAYSNRPYHVQLNVSEPDNDQSLSKTHDARPPYTGERLLRERPKIYRQVVRLIGEGLSANKICKWCHVTRKTVRAVDKREATEISARKNSIVGILGNVAELRASRMEETIGEAGLRDASDRNRDCCGQDARADRSNLVVPNCKHSVSQR
jgi:hypothetical protein